MVPRRLWVYGPGYEFIALRLIRKMDERGRTVQESREFQMIACYFEESDHLTEPT